MGTSLSVFVLLSVSVAVIRVASVALRLTGLTENTARFQALSAFTGTGFTTTEAEALVNYPVRRRKSQKKARTSTEKPGHPKFSPIELIQFHLGSYTSRIDKRRVDSWLFQCRRKAMFSICRFLEI